MILRKITYEIFEIRPRRLIFDAPPETEPDEAQETAEKPSEKLTRETLIEKAKPIFTGLNLDPAWTSTFSNENLQTFMQTWKELETLISLAEKDSLNRDDKLRHIEEQKTKMRNLIMAKYDILNGNQSKVPGLHTAYQEKVDSLESGTDKETLQKASIRDIRTENRLLNKQGENASESEQEKISNIKDETARRIKQYTDHYDGEWYTLNYEQVGGYEHEMNIGLGHVLIDPDIQNIIVWKTDGSKIPGTRKIFNNGRVGFESPDGEYIATFKGDRFKITSNSETDTGNEEARKAYFAQLGNEQKGNLKHEEHRRERATISLNTRIDTLRDVASATPTSEDRILEKLSKHREDASEILDFCKRACDAYGIPFMVYKELIQSESGWNPGAAYSGNINSDATGLGQFVGGTWEGFMDYYNKNHASIAEKGLEWVHKGPLTMADRTDPYANALATAWLMSQTKAKLGPKLEKEPLHAQGVIYALAHHEGFGGAMTYLKFIDAMKEAGAVTRRDVIEEFQKNPAKYQAILGSGQVDRIKKYGFDPYFLNVYFKYAKGIGARAGASNPDLVAKAREDLAANRVGESFKTPEELEGKIDVESNQDTWIMGSSTAYQMDKYKIGNTGIIGIVGANPRVFYKNLTEYVWPAIAHLKPPKQIVLVGIAVNGLSDKVSGSVQDNLDATMRIAKFLKSKGIKVKIATVQKPTAGNLQGKVALIEEYNKRLKEEHPEEYLDLMEIITTQMGTDILASDGLHLKPEAAQIAARTINEEAMKSA